MNLIDNGVGEFISFEKVDDGEHLGFKVTYVDWYGKKRFDYVNTISAVKTYQECKANWTE